MQNAIENLPNDKTTAKGFIINLELVLIEEASIREINFCLLKHKKKCLEQTKKAKDKDFVLSEEIVNQLENYTQHIYEVGGIYGRENVSDLSIDFL